MQKRRFRHQFQEKYGTLAMLGVVGYCVYNLFVGDHGLRAQSRLHAELSVARVRLAALEKEKEDLEQKVHGLHHNSLNRDLLDECARRALGYSQEDELIFIHPETEMTPGV